MPAVHTDLDARERFLEALSQSVQAGQLVKLVLARPVGQTPELQRITVKPLQIKGQPRLGLVLRYTTRDLTRHLPPEQALEAIAGYLPGEFRNAHLATTGETLQLEYTKKGKPMLHRAAAAQPAQAAVQAHDREKHRYLALERPFLAALGVTDRNGQLIPAMSRKWKQINKFIEVFDHALATSPLRDAGTLSVADFGSGKGYLTFAVHDHLAHGLGREAQVTGVELRPDMVRLCNEATQVLERPGLRFECGDVRSVVPTHLDVMIALHACDTATDHAIHTGIRAGAAIILCSPCCHKELRPQMHSPEVLGPMLQYGLHMGQQAEMATDALRALYLEVCGYDTKVFEFISLEHTSKNKMILAIKRAQPRDPAALLEKIQALKAFYGIQHHCLEALLKGDARV
ncbi:class I SAM-dependent methyltransferase [Pseudomonas typographi]|uniref:class I SAM-dependent methyltransferase n=1 Tax=Pseudomonas typographi TaxID=2715964 RepID=UPI001689F86F|nr:SAM-dependent methyltransferase [Pseudomonas typographi]MBD1552505.1 SAM-dependent methyltransferase [Pseudomonas typographi]MBD1585595.1 SAM-dependent methyltransferase [Pseudomonas typographi]